VTVETVVDRASRLVAALSDRRAVTRTSFYVTGLLQPGVTVAKANAQLQAVASEFRREFPTLT